MSNKPDENGFLNEHSLMIEACNGAWRIIAFEVDEEHGGKSVMDIAEQESLKSLRRWAKKQFDHIWPGRDFTAMWRHALANLSDDAKARLVTHNN